MTRYDEETAREEFLVLCQPWIDDLVPPFHLSQSMIALGT
jgi:hypothetical protein